MCKRTRRMGGQEDKGGEDWETTRSRSTGSENAQLDNQRAENGREQS
jgi:hypothetical protein